MRRPIAAAFALAFLAGCASTDGGDDCAALEAACRASCERDFEQNPSAWDYQSCLRSCEPDPGAICRR